MCLVTYQRLGKLERSTPFTGRCGHEEMFQTTRFWQIACCSLHHFSHASQDGYGKVSYLRLVD